MPPTKKQQKQDRLWELWQRWGHDIPLCYRRKCPICHREFYSTGAKAVFCRRKCERASLANRQRERRGRTERIRKTCEYCGTAFLTWWATARFCCSNHQKAAFKKRNG